MIGNLLFIKIRPFYSKIKYPLNKILKLSKYYFINFRQNHQEILNFLTYILLSILIHILLTFIIKFT